MGRPRLAIGTYGKIRCREIGPNRWRATVKYRDHDGVTRLVERVGRSSAAAERELKEALRDRAAVGRAGPIAGDTWFHVAAEQWHAGVAAAVEAGTRSPTTAEPYRRQLDNHVLPALGALRLKEATVPAVDRFLTTIRERSGVATARTCRSIVSGVLGLAVRHGALPSNPVRDVGRLERGRRPAPRALTPAERTAWLAQLETDEDAVRWDLPDLCRFMIATGVRIGEALAVCWPDVDLDADTVRIEHTAIRLTGAGLRRKSTKTAAGERTLPLPMWAVEMLKKRAADAEDLTGPVFPDALGGFRDPSNTRRMFRQSRGTDGFAWVTRHVFRRTAATILDEAGLSARIIADQLGHARPSLTQDVYMARKAPGRLAAALEAAFDPQYGVDGRKKTLRRAEGDRDKPG